MFELANTTAKATPGLTTQPVYSNQPPAVKQIVDAIQNQAGVSDMSAGVVYDIYTIPTSFTYNVTSNNGGSGVSKTVYAFNNDVLNAAVTTNDSGAASIVNSYGDGFGGRIYNQYLKTANAGRGILVKGFTAIATNFTSGVQLATPLSSLQFNIIAANGQGSVIPLPVDLNEALRNTQYQNGMLTIGKPFFFNALMQLQFTLPPNTALSFTFFTQASTF